MTPPSDPPSETPDRRSIRERVVECWPAALGSDGSRPEIEDHMTETDAVLWTVVIVVTVADVVLTISGLANGLREGNVVVRRMITTLGLPGFWIVKFLALSLLVAGWALLPERKATAFLAVFGLVTMGVVLHNAVLMLAI